MGQGMSSNICAATRKRAATEKTSEGRQGVVASKFRISVAGFY